MRKRSKRTQRQHHSRRDISLGRPMHITSHVADGVKSLRTPEIKATFRALVRRLRGRGVIVVEYAILATHIHLVVRVMRASGLGDGMRYLFSSLARLVNRLQGRRGSVFNDRFFSVIALSARQIWILFNYVAKNPTKAGYRSRGWDPYFGVDTAAISAWKPLRSVFGPAGQPLNELLYAMTRQSLAYRPVERRLQLSLW